MSMWPTCPRARCPCARKTRVNQGGVSCAKGSAIGGLLSGASADGRRPRAGRALTGQAEWLLLAGAGGGDQAEGAGQHHVAVGDRLVPAERAGEARAPSGR